MSISSMLFNGLSGVNSMSGLMGVVADNVANVNSVSYKASQMSFADMLSNSYGNVGQIGTGSNTHAVVKNFSPGSFETTARSTDMAISGNGFFILNNPDQAEPLYTRDGQFRAAEITGDPDAPWKLVNPEGYFVQGINTGSLVSPTGAVEDIVVAGKSQPKATEGVTLALNLQNDPASVETVEENLFSNWDGTNFTGGVSDPIAESAYDFKSIIKIYDDSIDNNGFDLSVYFDHTSQSNEREFLVTCDPTGDRRLIGTSGVRYNDGGVTVNKGAGALLYGKLSFSNKGELSKISCWDVPADGNLIPTTANQIDLARGEGFYSFDFNMSGVGPNLSSTLSFGTEPTPQVINSPGAALVDVGTTKIPLVSESTGWDKVYDADGNKVQVGDVITFAGSDGEGTPVSLAYAVDFSNTVGDLLSSLASQFSCNASIVDGGLQLEDLEVGDSQLAINAITYQDSSGNGPLANLSLAQVFGADGSIFETVPDDRAHSSAIGTTNYAVASKDLFKQQDGYASGYLMGVNVDKDGVLIGMYSNGEEIEQAQLMLADFVNYSGLNAVSGNNYLASEDAGAISIFAPGQDGVGEIAGNALEMSNVDLARQFVDLITTQRTFQANSVTIKTADEVYQTTLQMMR